MPSRFAKELTEEFLYNQYVTLHKSAGEIATEFGYVKITVLKYIWKYEIQKKRKHLARGFNLHGKKFDYFDIIKLDDSVDPNRKSKSLYWICKCYCGNEFSARGSRIIVGGTKSCGCLSHESLRKGYKEIDGKYWSTVRNGAKRRNLELSISIEQAYELYLKQDKKCALTGIDIVFRKRKSKFTDTTASLDRIDSSKGYTIDNIQWIYKDLQAMKMSMPESIFIEWCRKVANHADRKTGEKEINPSP